MPYLEPLKSKIKKFNLYSFDIETYSKLNLFLMGSIGFFDYNNNFKYFLSYNKKSLIEYFLNLCCEYNTKKVFASNLGFDILSLFEDTEYFDNLKFTARGSDIIKVRLYRDNKRFLDFYDTFNFASYSVANLGKIINIEKLKHPEFLGNIPKTKKEFNELDLYNIQDTKITLYFAKFLQDSFNILGTELKTTIASNSMDLFRRKYLKYKIYQPDKKLIEIMYKGYYGGRTETFKRGYFKEKLYYSDFNSCYIKQYEKTFPNPNYIKYTKKATKDILKFEGLTKVKIKSNGALIPFLPYRDDERKKLIFPNGTFEGYYTNLEIREAIKRGYKIIQLYESIYYTENFNPFGDFGKDLYKLRLKYKSQNNKMELPIKILLNSLYGKFAQKLENTEIINLNTITKDELFNYLNSDLKTEVIEPFLYVTQEKDLIPNFINPILSIYITAYARLDLYMYMERAGFENVYYCDTDSLITNNFIEDSKELGKMKVEHILNECILIKPKLYAFKDSENKEYIKSKGIPLFKLKDNQTYFNYFKSFLDSKIVEYEKFTKFKEANRSQDKYKKGKLKYNEIQLIKKDIDLNDNKRIWKNKFDWKKTENSEAIVL